MSNVETFLSHHGVKGMKWGVRKDRGHEGERVKSKKLAKLDKKFESKSATMDLSIKVYNRAAELSNQNMDRINNKPKYKGADFTRDTPLRRQYYKEHQDAFLSNARKAAEELGTNASGTRRYVVMEHGDGLWNVVASDVQHANEVIASVRPIYDKSGRITSLEPQTPLQHSSSDEFLEHYGVKGMQWGVRKDRSSKIGLAGKLSQHKAKLQANRKRFPKAIDLSDDELKTRIARLQLESNYNRLVTDATSSAGKKFVMDFLTNYARSTLNSVVKENAITKIVKKDS